MSNERPFLLFAVASVLLLSLFSSQPAHAYIGPGAGLTAIGSFLALIVALIVAVIGFFWYPIKRMLNKRKSSNNEQE